MIAIIDYDAGNIKSVEKALVYLGADAVITRDRDIILSADGTILPGVGSFGDAMQKLNDYDLVSTINDFVKTGKPFLGICLGLQLLFNSSEESPGVTGLGLIDGEIKKIPNNDDVGNVYKVPHIGWNSLNVKNSRLLAGVPEESYVYFVHSYYLKAAHDEDVIARTNYNVSIDAAVERKNVMATQFHPEKSSEVGLKILQNFINMTREGK